MSGKVTRYRAWSVAFGGLALAALACVAPGGSATTPSAAPAVTVVVATPETASTINPPQPSGPSPVPQGPTATAGGPPTSSTTQAATDGSAPPNAPAPNATYDNISFYYDVRVIPQWQVEIKPADPADTGAPQAWLVPSHYAFTFPAYPVTNTYQPPRILVFPVANWQGDYNPSGGQRIPQLQKVLADKPASFTGNNEIPVLPIFNAGQLFRARIQYLSFQNGTGIRFIAQWDQAPIPINNGELVYVFQGLTADGIYYVSAFFPISHPSLPADEANPEAAIGSDFLAYLDKMTTSLNAVSDDSFTPSLGQLDVMMQSLKVK